LLAVHKATSYADVFVKEIVTALGKATGEKLAELSKTAGKRIVDGSIALFKTASNRILASLANGKNSRIYLTFETNIEVIPFEAGGQIATSSMQVGSEEERQRFRDNMAELLFFMVFPAAREFAAQSKLQQTPLRRLEAPLRSSDKTLGWHLEASPIVELAVDEQGIMRPLNG
jgi:hypothetical protein